MRIGKIGVVVIGLVPFNVYAECTPTPDCDAIGYTETSCETISLKCPFDQSKLYCFPCDSSYQYSCSEPNEYGNGESCNNKYKACCNTNCVVGNYYYADGSCSSCVDNSKILVGLVVKDNEIVMSYDIITSNWAPDAVEINNLTYITDTTSALADYNGMNNTSAIVAYYGSNASNVAGVYCYNYAPANFSTSINNWYLPAQAEVNDFLYKNWEKLALSLEKLNKSLPNVYVWSSTVHSAHTAWTVMMDCGYINPRGDTKYNYQLSTICLLQI